ncbi:hypothetical protein [Lysobacter sp.]|uniref:hypothetical protein n=1 Tax=Lysobacter sp. TaxID=72226 RepID=UPI002D4EA566|nr:hypothetical protein [Lysobacter sp.]HZX76382.1 hypothetical protein [Lysobacter sp.]
MNSATRAALLACLLAPVIAPPIAAAQATGHPAPPPREDLHDGPEDFDFEIGTWQTRVTRRLRPLTGSTEWVDYEGRSVVRRIGEGPANVVALDVQGPAGRIQGLSLRLYDPRARQWSLHYSNNASGTLTPPVVGGFRDGRGEFHGQDTLADGRTVFVRFTISCVTPDECHFEQAFSADGGRTWEVNWIATDRRIDESKR